VRKKTEKACVIWWACAVLWQTMTVLVLFNMRPLSVGCLFAYLPRLFVALAPSLMRDRP